MSTPTEILYWEILPSIRSAIVFELKEEGLKQNEIANFLGVTPAAISQYLKQKRGKFVFDSKFKLLIKESVQKILNKKSTAFAETNFLIKEFEKLGHLCKLCVDKNSLDKCNICYNK